MGKACSKEEYGRLQRAAAQSRTNSSSTSGRLAAAATARMTREDLIAVAAAAAASLNPTEGEGPAAVRDAAERTAAAAATSTCGEAAGAVSQRAMQGENTPEGRRSKEGEEGEGGVAAAKGVHAEGRVQQKNGEQQTVLLVSAAAPHPQQRGEKEDDQQQSKKEKKVEGVVDSSVVIVGGKKPEGKEATGEALLHPPPHFLAMDGVEEVSENFTFYVEIFGLKCRNLRLPPCLSSTSSDLLFDPCLFGPTAPAGRAAAAGAPPAAVEGAAAGAGAAGAGAAGAAGAGRSSGGGWGKGDEEEQKKQQQRSSMAQWLLLPFLAGAYKEHHQQAAALGAAATAGGEAAAAAGPFDAGVHPYLFCAVDWVDCTLYVETEGAPVTAAPAWPSSRCQFSWCCSLLRQLQQRRVTISIYGCVPQQLQEISSVPPSLSVPPHPVPSSVAACSPPAPAAASSLVAAHAAAPASSPAAASSAASSPAAASSAAPASSAAADSSTAAAACASSADATAAASCRRRRGGGGGEVTLSEDDAAAEQKQQQQQDAVEAAVAGCVAQGQQQQRQEAAKAATGRAARVLSILPQGGETFHSSIERWSRSRNKVSSSNDGIADVERGKGARQRKGVVVLIGRTSVDLLTVATGPVHHDLLLQRPLLAAEKQQRRIQQQQQQRTPQQYGKAELTGTKETLLLQKEKEGKEEEEELIDCGRVVVDIKMAQICRLIINPIEVLVRLQQEQQHSAMSASSRAATARRLTAASLRAAGRSRAFGAAAAAAAREKQTGFYESEGEFFAAATDTLIPPREQQATATGHFHAAAAAAETRKDTQRGGDRHAKGCTGIEGAAAKEALSTATKKHMRGRERPIEVKPKHPEVISSSLTCSSLTFAESQGGKASPTEQQQQQRQKRWQQQDEDPCYEGRDRWSAAGAAATAAAAAAAAAAEEQQLEETDTAAGTAEEEEAFLQGETDLAACSVKRMKTQQQSLEEEEEGENAARDAATAAAEGATAAEGVSSLVPPEEEPAPLLAHWQLSFRVTGVVNAASFFSTWTEKTDQPYWNTVDHSLLQLTGRPCCIYTAGGDTRNNQAKQQPDAGKRSGVFTTSSEAAAVATEGDNGPQALKPSAEEGGGETHGAGRDIFRGSKHEGSGRWRSLLDIFGLSSWRCEAPSPQTTAASDSSTRRASISSSSSFSSSSSSSSSSSGSGLSASPSSTTRQQQQEREGLLDRKSTYKRLAALARRGRLVKEVLYDDFPTLQLVTTVDALRQNYLQISLFSRCFSADVPVFQGECWLPFMKLYEADVADEVEKHFYESSFCERLWVDGRCVGEIEGILVFQNNPIVRQMHAGVHTENGCMRMLPPIMQLQQQLQHDEDPDQEAEKQEEEEEKEEREEEEQRKLNEANAEGGTEDRRAAKREETEEVQEKKSRGGGGGGDGATLMKRKQLLLLERSRSTRDRLLQLLPLPIQRVAALHRTLLDLLFSKAQHKPQEVLTRHVNPRGPDRAAAAAAAAARGPAAEEPAATKEKDALHATANWLLPDATAVHGKSFARVETDDAAENEGMAVHFQRVCEELLQLLSEGDGEMRRCFLYATEEALLTAQQVFLNLATHVLEYMDYVHWQQRVLYSSILHLILRRGELDIGTLIPSKAAIERHCMRRFERHLQAVALLQEERQQQRHKEEQPDAEVLLLLQEREAQQQQQQQHTLQDGEEAKATPVMVKKAEPGMVQEHKRNTNRKEKKQQEEQAKEREEEEARQQRLQELHEIERDLHSSDEEEEEEDGPIEKAAEVTGKRRRQQQQLRFNAAKIHLLYCFAKRFARLASRTSTVMSPTEKELQQQSGDAAPAAPSPQTRGGDASTEPGAVGDKAAAAGGRGGDAGRTGAAVEGGTTAGESAVAAARGEAFAPAAACWNAAPAPVTAEPPQQQRFTSDKPNLVSVSRRNSAAGALALSQGAAASAAGTSTIDASSFGAHAYPPSAVAVSPPAAAPGGRKRRSTRERLLSRLRDITRRKHSHPAAAATGREPLQQQQQMGDALAEGSAAASPLLCTTVTHGAAASTAATATAATATARSLSFEDQRSRPRDEEEEVPEAADWRQAGSDEFFSLMDESCGVALREGSTFSYTSGTSCIYSQPSFASAAGKNASSSRQQTCLAGSAVSFGPLLQHRGRVCPAAALLQCKAAAAAGADPQLPCGREGGSSSSELLYSSAELQQRQQVGVQQAVNSDINAAVAAALARVAQELPQAGREALTIYHRRMKIARQYYVLLHRTLLHALEQLKPGTATGVVFEAQRRYVAVFLAIAYFRLPAFQDELLACVLSPSEREAAMPEWRGTEYSLDAESLERMQHWEKHSELRVSLDWSAFHATLKKYFGSSALRQTVICMQGECGASTTQPHHPLAGAAFGDWRTAAAAGAPSSSCAADTFSAELSSSWRWHFLPPNRGSLFFAFLEQWCRYVFQSVPSLYNSTASAAAQARDDTEPSSTLAGKRRADTENLGEGGAGSAATAQKKLTGVPLIGSAAAVLPKKTAAAFAAALTAGARGRLGPSDDRQGAGMKTDMKSRDASAAAVSLPQQQRDIGAITWSTQRMEGSGTPGLLLLLPWQEIPGYAVLLKALLLEMKKWPVTKYPDSLLNSSGAMLANVKLLSVFSKVLFLKTSVYNSPAVFAALNYLDYWMQVVRMRGQKLPPGFDFNFLRRGLQIVISSDLCVNVAKGIWFIYKNLPVLLPLRQPSQQGSEAVYTSDSTGAAKLASSGPPGLGGCVPAGATDFNTGANILYLVVHEQFPRLFLSWSWLVRKAYMWFLLYRVCEGARKVVTRANPLLAAVRATAQATATNAAVGAATATATSPPSTAGSNTSAGGGAAPTGEVHTRAEAETRPAAAADAGPSQKVLKEAAAGGTAQQGSVAAAGIDSALTEEKTNNGDASLRNLLSQLQLTEEEMLSFQAYMVLAGFLKRLEAPLVLPYKTTSVVALALQRQQSAERECAAAAGAQPFSRGGKFRYMLTATSASDVKATTDPARSRGATRNNGVITLSAAAAAGSSSAAGNSGHPTESHDTYMTPGNMEALTEAVHSAAAAGNSDTAEAAAAPHASVVPDTSIRRLNEGAAALQSEKTRDSSQEQQQGQGFNTNVIKAENPSTTPSAGGREKSEPSEGQRDESADSEKHATGAAAAHLEDPEAEQLRLWLNGESTILPPQRAVYVAIAQREWIDEVAVYRDWVMAGASPLPSMHIPSAPLDANTDVPLDS